MSVFLGAIKKTKTQQTRQEIESLGYRIFANNRRASHPKYGMVYGNSFKELLNNIERQLKSYHY